MTKSESLCACLREYAEALDKDRGHDKSAVTRLMREAAERLQRIASLDEQDGAHIALGRAKRIARGE